MFYQIPGYILHSITRMWKKRRRVPGNHPNPKTSQSHGKWHHLKNRLQQIPEHQLWRPSVGTIKSGRDFAKLFCLSPSKASRKCEDAVHDLLARFLHGFVHEIWKQWPGKPTWPKSEFWPVRARMTGVLSHLPHQENEHCKPPPSWCDTSLKRTDEVAQFPDQQRRGGGALQNIPLRFWKQGWGLTSILDCCSWYLVVLILPGWYPCLSIFMLPYCLSLCTVARLPVHYQVLRVCFRSQEHKKYSETKLQPPESRPTEYLPLCNTYSMFVCVCVGAQVSLPIWFSTCTTPMLAKRPWPRMWEHLHQPTHCNKKISIPR